METPQRLLVCLRYGIGDVVMELPALRALRTRWPGAHLTLLGARPSLELLEDDPDFDALVCVQDLGFEHWGDRGQPQAHAAFWDWFSRQDFDCVLDGSHAVAGVRIALMHSPVAQFSTDERVRVARPVTGGRGAQSIWESACAAWGLYPEPPPAPRLFVPAAVQRWVRDVVAREDLGPRLVGLAPVASSALKRWPAARVCSLVASLPPDPGRDVLVFGLGAREQALEAQLRRAAAPNRVHLVSPCHLQQTAALIAHCRAFVSNDTGLMHMAAAVGTPTVGIFGPTSPHIYLPEGATAVGGEDGCAHRPADRFGPPACVLEGRCLINRRSCITAVSVPAVRAALERALGDGSACAAEETGVRS